LQNERRLTWKVTRKITNIELLKEEERRVQEKLQVMEKILIIKKKWHEKSQIYVFEEYSSDKWINVQMWEKKYNYDGSEIDTDILELEKARKFEKSI
jgi:hypothetical protein